MKGFKAALTARGIFSATNAVTPERYVDDLYLRKGCGVIVVPATVASRAVNQRTGLHKGSYCSLVEHGQPGQDLAPRVIFSIAKELRRNSSGMMAVHQN
jgi:hypothetical protein